MGIYQDWTPPSSKKNLPVTATDRVESLRLSAQSIAGRAEDVARLYAKVFKLREADFDKHSAKIYVVADDAGKKAAALKVAIDELLALHQQFRDRLSWEAYNSYNPRR